MAVWRLLVYVVILGFLPGHPPQRSCSLKTPITGVTAKLKHVFSEAPQGLPWGLSGKELAEHRQGRPTGDGLSANGHRDICSSSLPRPLLKIITVISPSLLQLEKNTLHAVGLWAKFPSEHLEVISLLERVCNIYIFLRCLLKYFKEFIEFIAILSVLCSVFLARRHMGS